MKFVRCLPFVFLLFVLVASQALGFHVPPWDSGHNSFTPDNGDDDNDPGNDACPPKACCPITRNSSPVEFASGNFAYHLPILSVEGLGPAIDLMLTYNSRSNHKGAFGHGWVQPYEQRLIETTDGVDIYVICAKSNGKRERFKRNVDGSFSPPPYLLEKLAKNSDGTFSLRDSNGKVQRFTTEGRLSAIVDRNDNKLNFTYDSTGFMTKLTDAVGRSIDFVKGSDGRVTSITDPAGKVYRFSYDNAGNLIRYTDPLGNATVYQYDSKNNLTAVQDPRGGILMRLAYDSEGKVITHVDETETWTYGYFEKRTTKRDSRGNIWTFEYNDTGNVTRRTDPFGGTETYAYDASLNVVQFTNKNGSTTRTTYDVSGNALTFTDALGNVRVIAYEPLFNRPVAVHDARGNAVRFDYDARGNLITMVNVLGQLKRFQYNANGQLIRVTDELGQASTFTYDGSGNLIRATDPLGNSSSATYDVLGNTLTMTDAEGRTMQFAYDDAGRPLRAIDTIGGVTAYEYDSFDNLTSLTSPNRAKTRFEYDAFNRLVKLTNHLGQSMAYTYDRRGNIASLTIPKGDVITYTHDALDRLVRLNKLGDIVSNAYDRMGNLTSLTDSDSNLAFAYDALDRVIEAKTAATAGQPATSIRFTYDANGNRQTMIDPSGGTTTYSYDALSQITSLVDPTGSSFAWTYDALSRRVGLSRPGGLTTSYSYDPASRLTSLIHNGGPGILPLTFSYNRVGQIQTAIDFAGSNSYAYDSLSRLLSATHPAGNPTESYTYDALGNRLTSHLSASHVYNLANRLTADAKFDYFYDANGNLIRKTERATSRITAFTYDVENQLTRIDFPGSGFTSYRYDGLHRRIEKNVNGQITRYVYDGQSILFEYSGNSLSARYTHGPGIDEPLSIQRGGITSYFQADALGSVIRVVDSGMVKASYVYDTFGRIVSQTGSSPSSYAYQGREFDSESGLYFYRARYYDPQIGRFINEDPLNLESGLNLYSFVDNNPVNLTDPTGMEGVGHHYVPQSIFGRANLPSDAFEIFDRTTTGPTDPTHGWSKPHKDYNDAVRRMWNDYLSRNKIDPSKMTKEQAEKFLRNVQSSRNPAISKFIKEQEKRAARYAAKKAGRKLVKKGIGAVCRKVPIVGLGFFLYDYSQGGLGYAADETLWPVSEIWRDN